MWWWGGKEGEAWGCGGGVVKRFWEGGVVVWGGEGCGCGTAGGGVGERGGGGGEGAGKA